MQSILAEASVYDEKLLTASSAADTFQGYADGHATRLAELVDILGREMKLDSHDRYFLQQAALVRGAGLVEMNRSYISMPRALAPEERLDLQRHPVIGEQWCSRRGLSRNVQLTVRWQHEWWCGSGYPDGLAGEEIPLTARILRVADTFSALRAKRFFRESLPLERTHQYLTEWAGIEFDPAVVGAFLSLPAEALPEANARNN